MNKTRQNLKITSSDARILSKISEQGSLTGLTVEMIAIQRGLIKEEGIIPSKLNNTTTDFTLFLFFLNLRSSPRTISIGQLHTLLHFHLRPINHVVFMDPYQITLWEILS